jgi:hypothetical protein
LEAGQRVYGFLEDLGFRTTKAVWPIRGSRTPSDHGDTCAELAYRLWVQGLKARGFEIGYHNATAHTSLREETLRGLETFVEYFGANPRVMAQHYFCEENIYWGDQRVTGVHRALYRVLTRTRNRFFGHVPGHPYFWGDLCQERITYVRNFVFRDVNTHRACPIFPYHDPLRPYVKYWYASSEGAEPHLFCERISEANQDRLDAEGGVCIMYTHLGGFVDRRGKLDERFAALMTRLSRKNGWFVPVSVVLDHMLAQRPDPVLTDRQRRSLERRWLSEKIRYGSA